MIIKTKKKKKKNLTGICRAIFSLVKSKIIHIILYYVYAHIFFLFYFIFFTCQKLFMSKHKCSYRRQVWQCVNYILVWFENSQYNRIQFTAAGNHELRGKSLTVRYKHDKWQNIKRIIKNTIFFFFSLKVFNKCQWINLILTVFRDVYNYYYVSKLIINLLQNF